MAINLRNKVNRRKGRWRDKNMHAREIKEKIKEDEREREKGKEETPDINNKKALKK